MTHKETIKRIQKLVPSVMALEFGCKINIGYDKDVFFVKMDDKCIVWIDNEEDNCDENTTELQYLNYTILGKPITLAVLFQAFENNKTEVELSIFANKILIGHYEKPNQEGYYTHCYWNLSKDNFNDQSEETKGFIGGLLGN